MSQDAAPDETADQALDDTGVGDTRAAGEHGSDGVSTGLAAARGLRRARRRNRMADLEWFELIYRVYIAAFLGGGAILFLSDLVKDDPVGLAGIADVNEHGPAIIGLVTVVMIALGLRSGSNGGPIALEDADVRHVLLAPISHERILLHPAIQRLRTLAFAGALAGGVVGQLAGRRLPGTEMAWALAGALFGAISGALFVAAALIAHGLRVPRWLATGAGAALIAWQAASVAGRAPGPADGLGQTALWGMEVHPVDIASLVGAALIVALSLLVLRSLSLEALSRRSALVSQLRFAVTLQDMRTVMLLRRQLAQEHSRLRPWIRLPRVGRLPASWRRGWHGVMRFPVSRLVRMIVLVATAAVCQVLAWRGTSPAIVGSGLALFVLGLEVLEPLSQEIDQSDRTDSMPRHRGEIHLRLMAPSAVFAAILSLVGIGVAMAMEPSTTTLALGAVIAVPVMLGAMAGSALNIVSGAPDPTAEATERTMMPPEVAGTTTLIKAVWPVALSILACVPVLAARSADKLGDSPVAMGARMSILSLLIAVGGATWVRRRDDAKAWFKLSAEQGNAMRQSNSSSTSGTTGRR